MSGLLFEYSPGVLNAKFSYGEMFDSIKLNIQMGGAMMKTSEFGGPSNLEMSKTHRQDLDDFSVYMTSVFCPFHDFLLFLESVALDGQECAFAWDAEGDDGRMAWKRRFKDDSGFLTVHWSGIESEDGPDFSRRVMLNTRQTVKTLYFAFRQFVDASTYDPLRYEALTFGAAIDQVISDCNLDVFANMLIELDELTAEQLILGVRKAIENRRVGGGKEFFPLKHYLDARISPCIFGEYDTWINPEWNTWDSVRRLEALRNTVFPGGGMGWFGDNLRQMRSPAIEAWLAKWETSFSEHCLEPRKK